MGLRFDGILAVEVIEHLSDEQLASTVDIIKRMLEPGRDTGLPHLVAAGRLPLPRH